MRLRKFLQDGRLSRIQKGWFAKPFYFKKLHAVIYFQVSGPFTQKNTLNRGWSWNIFKDGCGLQPGWIRLFMGCFFWAYNPWVDNPRLTTRKQPNPGFLKKQPCFTALTLGFNPYYKQPRLFICVINPLGLSTEINNPTVDKGLITHNTIFKTNLGI